MDLVSQIGLHSLMVISDGDPNTVIGIIDGLVDLDHRAFQKSNIKTIRIRNLLPVKTLVA